MTGRCGHGSPCEQLCYELHDGMYECDCTEGYELNKNGYSCQGKLLYICDENFYFKKCRLPFEHSRDKRNFFTHDNWRDETAAEGINLPKNKNATPKKERRRISKVNGFLM